LIKLVGFHVEKKLHQKFKAKIALLGLTQDSVLSDIIEEYVKNEE